MGVVISSYQQIFYSINKRTYAMNVYKVCESIQCHEISNMTSYLVTGTKRTIDVIVEILS